MNPTDLDLIRILTDPDRATLTLTEAAGERLRESPTPPRETLRPTEVAMPTRRRDGMRAPVVLLLGA